MHSAAAAAVGLCSPRWVNVDPPVEVKAHHTFLCLQGDCLSLQWHWKPLGQTHTATQTNVCVIPWSSAHPISTHMKKVRREQRQCTSSPFISLNHYISCHVIEWSIVCWSDIWVGTCYSKKNGICFWATLRHKTLHIQCLHRFYELASLKTANIANDILQACKGSIIFITLWYLTFISVVCVVFIVSIE